MAADYDDLRPEVRESQQDSLAAVKSANAPDPRSVVRELDSEEYQDEAELRGGEFVDGELTVHLVPQGEDESSASPASSSATAPRSPGPTPPALTAATAKPEPPPPGRAASGRSIGKPSIPVLRAAPCGQTSKACGGARRWAGVSPRRPASPDALHPRARIDQTWAAGLGARGSASLLSPGVHGRSIF
jgi:hypothetical protein